MSKLSGTPDRTITLPRVDPDRLDLTGKRIAVVGGTGGLGRALAAFMAARGAEVTVVGRTFRDQGVARLSFVPADLESMAEARRVGQALPAEALDALVLTTGIMTARAREATREGLERDLAVSYLSRLAIVREAAPRLGSARSGGPRPRLFVMGFPGTGQAGDPDDLNSERSYQAFAAHMNTVAGNEALVLDAAARYPHLGAFGLNPGLIATDIRSNYLGAGSFKHRAIEWLIGLFMPSPEKYARRVGAALFAPELERASGIHINPKGVAIRPSEVMTPERVSTLIARSEALLSRALGAAGATGAAAQAS
ncbi:MAG TPA: SDR family NAD(P)-dependent oxidoreductase [Kofleriaceae bacterium]|nr:SDR family NAD(P)-dependent oxidoreductase [Kofleriaceae bacterium]